MINIMQKLLEENIAESEQSLEIVVSIFSNNSVKILFRNTTCAKDQLKLKILS